METDEIRLGITLAKAIRSVPIGPFGPNAQETLSRGGSVYLTKEEADKIVEQIKPVLHYENAIYRRELGNALLEKDRIGIHLFEAETKILSLQKKLNDAEKAVINLI